MASWTDVPPGEEGGLPAYRLFTGDVEKPAADDRAYRVLALQNGLRALLVRDPQADMAAACVALAIGHMHDPVRRFFPLSYCCARVHVCMYVRARRKRVWP